MRVFACLILIATVAGCVPQADTQGHIVELTDRTVKIRGAYDMSLAGAFDGKPAAPTQAMVAQAQEVCPGAKYLTAIATPGNGYTFDYLFQCR